MHHSLCNQKGFDAFVIGDDETEHLDECTQASRLCLHVNCNQLPGLYLNTFQVRMHGLWEAHNKNQSHQDREGIRWLTGAVSSVRPPKVQPKP